MHNETTNPYHPSDEVLESQIVQLTRDLVLIESTHSKPEERRRCFQFVRNHLDGIPDLEIKMYESEGYESLVALPSKVTKPAVLLCAHLDVVEHLGPEYYQSKIEGGKIHGPGAGDMKGALAIILYLFRNMILRNPDSSIGLAITSDEERGGENGARYLVDEIGLRADAVVIPDGGSIDEVTIEEKGILHVKAWLPGRSAHAARPWLGVNPLQKLSAGLQRLELRFAELAKGHELPDGDERSDHWYPTCSITRIESDNESINRIPDDAVATFDIRFPEPHTAESMLQILKDELDPEAKIEPIISADPTRLDPDPDFLKAIEAILGRPPHLAKMAGGSDARFFRKHGIPVKLSRPIVGNLHGHDEWIDIRSMVDYYRICERYIRWVHDRV